ESGRRVPRHGCRLELLDHVEVAEVDAVVAAHGESHRPDGSGGQAEMDLQLNTFSGTNVRRSGSVWPSATSRPPASCARTGPGPHPQRTSLRATAWGPGWKSSTVTARTSTSRAGGRGASPSRASL